jgi:hypothetical protein
MKTAAPHCVYTDVASVYFGDRMAYYTIAEKWLLCTMNVFVPLQVTLLME